MKTRDVLLAFAATVAVGLLAQAGWAADTNGKASVKPAAYATAKEASGDSLAYESPCDTGCELSCNGESCCSAPCWQFYGDYLYLRPRNAGLEYAVPMNGPISPGEVPIQEGRTATLNPDFESGFRVGGSMAFGNCSNISVAYTRYENSIQDAISTQSPQVIRAMVLHPSTPDAAADWLDAGAHEYIRYNMADLDYRHEFYSDECASATYLIGIRYANLDQLFGAQYESTIRENVDTQVKFDGAGLRLGLEGERTGYRNLFVYGRASASFVGGEFRGTYLQGSTTDPVIVDTDWKEARLVSILDCEVGLGWTGCSGHVRASAGYMVNAWLNVVKQSEFISAVQANKYHGPDKIDGNGLVFDGLVAHLELRR